MKNIVLIDHEPFTKRRKELFHINELIENGFNVQVWDVSQYVFPGLKLVDTIDEEIVSKIHNISQLINIIKNIDITNTIFIVECVNKWHTKKLYKLLSDYKCFTVRIDLYANTELIEPLKYKFSRLFSKLCGKIILGKIEYLAKLIYWKYYRIKNFDAYFSSSRIVKRTNTINHPDYENYKFKSHKRIIPHDYIVFCDTYFPFHPDYKFFHKYNTSIDGKKYQKDMTDFFTKIENKYKLPVIIAAHPKADYKGDEFGGRKIIKYKTDNLVINATRVILHVCNSISYSILSNKPFALITTDGYNSIEISKNKLLLMGKIFNKQVFNINKDNIDMIDFKEVDENIRNKYIYTYLTTRETEDIKNIDILIHYFKLK